MANIFKNPKKALKKAWKSVEKSELGKIGGSIISGIEKGWKDIWDPGREDREKLETLFAEKEAEQKSQQQDLVDRSKQAEAQNRAWAEAYLSRLKGAPDTAFNQGLSALERGVADSKTNLANIMARRGIGGSGIDLGALAGTDALRARGISALQGQRVHNQLGSDAQALNVMSGLNSDSFNMLRSAYGFNNNATLPNYMNYLQQGANAPSLGGELLRTYLGSLFGGMGGQRAQMTDYSAGSGYNPSLNDLEFMLKGAY